MDIIVAALVIGPVIGIAIFIAFQQWLPRKHLSQLDPCGAAGDPLRRARQDRRLPLRPPGLERWAAQLIPPSTHVDSVEIEQLLKRHAGEAEADEKTVVEDILSGQYSSPEITPYTRLDAHVL